jgi:hypothetical protein
MKVKLRSSKMVISTGMTLPRMASVAALYCLQNSMMLTPWGPRAVPTGGAGVAEPAFRATLTSAATFFLGGMTEWVLAVVDGLGQGGSTHWWWTWHAPPRRTTR